MMNCQNEIVITGITSNLGRAVASVLSTSADVRIIGTTRRSGSDVGHFPRNVEIIEDCDLCEVTACEVLASAASRFEGPFGLVHSVGEFFPQAPFLDFIPGDLEKLLLSHVATFQNVVRCLVPAMIPRGGGACISFSCNSTVYNYPHMSTYTASKSAIESLTRSFANEFSGYGIRFNSLMLASLKTPREELLKPHGDFDNYVPPEDVAPIIRFLLSKEAYLINGSVVNLFKHSPEFFNTGFFERISR
jgi:NAD(P)-dependent dehydrogenase (short-subunit alcohol dehydrogenase family)